ncbi:hypothetical protein [Burkholderia guangdongensis]|uniref:hypothetical protein n=1 Tax=Burkholderia guangdongensis TaxID=1792500 RepID=UPI0015CC1E4D|nr:hypothetical protein [Burkholderia guangdongensis]
MSHSAHDLIELLRLAEGGAGALTQHLLRELARSLIAAGIGDAPPSLPAVIRD